MGFQRSNPNFKTSLIIKLTIKNTNPLKKFQNSMFEIFILFLF